MQANKYKVIIPQCSPGNKHPQEVTANVTALNKNKKANHAPVTTFRIICSLPEGEMLNTLLNAHLGGASCAADEHQMKNHVKT